MIATCCLPDPRCERPRPRPLPELLRLIGSGGPAGDEGEAVIGIDGPLEMEEGSSGSADAREMVRLGRPEKVEVEASISEMGGVILQQSSSKSSSVSPNRNCSSAANSAEDFGGVPI